MVFYLIHGFIWTERFFCVCEWEEWGKNKHFGCLSSTYLYASTLVAFASLGHKRQLSVDRALILKAGRTGPISGASLLDLARLSAPRAPGTHQRTAQRQQQQQRRCCMGGRGAPQTRNVLIWRLTATRVRAWVAHCLGTGVGVARGRRDARFARRRGGATPRLHCVQLVASNAPFTSARPLPPPKEPAGLSLAPFTHDANELAGVTH